MNEELITPNSISKTVKFKTTIHFKNGSKETIFHSKPPQADANRLIHFQLKEDEGCAYNLDDVRKFESKAFVERDVKIIA